MELSILKIIVIITLKESMAEIGQGLILFNNFGTLLKVLNPSNCLQQHYIDKIGHLRGSNSEFLDLISPISSLRTE